MLLALAFLSLAMPGHPVNPSQYQLPPNTTQWNRDIDQFFCTEIVHSPSYYTGLTIDMSIWPVICHNFHRIIIKEIILVRKLGYIFNLRRMKIINESLHEASRNKCINMIDDGVLGVVDSPHSGNPNPLRLVICLYLQTWHQYFQHNPT